jgi:DNA-directed RNA polymerase subunit RPC12/RpoP
MEQGRVKHQPYFCTPCSRWVGASPDIFNALRCPFCGALLKSTKSQPVREPTNASHATVAAFCEELRREMGVSEEEFNSLI